MLKIMAFLFWFIAGILFFGFLAACQTPVETGISPTAYPTPIETGTSLDECLAPLFDFSYPYRETANEDERLPATWVPGILPQVDKNAQPIAVISSDLVVRGDDEIWLLEPLMRYTPSTKEIKEYSVLDHEGNMIYPGSLFLTSNNILYLEADNSALDGIVFARYDDRNDGFEVISPADHPLLGGYVGTGLAILDDESNDLWFINIDSSLIRFDLKTHRMKEMLGETQGYLLMNMLAKSPDSDYVFWIAFRTIEKRSDNDIGYSDLMIGQYDTHTGDIQHIGAPPIPDGPLGKLFVDDKNRLWVGDNGYFEVGDDGYYELDYIGLWKWNQVIKSPIFITDQMKWLPSQYSWVIANPSLNTHGKYLWFTFTGGLARLDINTNKWCLVARMPVYDVAVDSHENLWFVSDKQLYKYEFRP